MTTKDSTFALLLLQITVFSNKVNGVASEDDAYGQLFLWSSSSCQELISSTAHLVMLSNGSEMWVR